MAPNPRPAKARNCLSALLAVSLASCGQDPAAPQANEGPDRQSAADHTPTKAVVADPGPGAASRIEVESTHRSETSPTPRDFGSVQLVALDKRNRLPIRSFWWEPIGHSSTGLRSSGQSIDGVGVMQVARHERVSVRVFAPGYVASLAIDVSLRDEVMRMVEAVLVPELADAQVIVAVTDHTGMPMSHVIIDCLLASKDRDRHSRWQYAWSLPSRADDGRHRFAGLEEGRHRFKVRAVGRDGRPALLLPGSCEFSYYAGRTVHRDVTLTQGGTIELHGDRPDTVLRLRYATGTSLRSLTWTVIGTPWGEATEPVEGPFPGNGPWELTEAVAPGDYVLVPANSELPEIPLTITAGLRTRVWL